MCCSFASCAYLAVPWTLFYSLILYNMYIMVFHELFVLFPHSSDFDLILLLSMKFFHNLVLMQDRSYVCPVRTIKVVAMLHHICVYSPELFILLYSNDCFTSTTRTFAEVMWKALWIRSVHTIPQLRCVAALHTHAMLLDCIVAWKLNFNLKWSDAAVTCGRDVIDISAPQRNCGKVWTDLKIAVKNERTLSCLKLMRTNVRVKSFLT